MSSLEVGFSHDIFVDMAELLLKNNNVQKPLSFHIIGDGSLRSALETKVANLKRGNHIYFHGHRNDMASCIKSLDLIVMCSDHEGMPMTALESLALGTPLIAHKTGGLKDLLEKYPTLLVTDHSPAGYAECINLHHLSEEFSVELDECYSATANSSSTLQLYSKISNAH
jgi:glycosyltransferase involved in cell wall biosynthesis